MPPLSYGANIRLLSIDIAWYSTMAKLSKRSGSNIKFTILLYLFSDGDSVSQLPWQQVQQYIRIRSSSTANPKVPQSGLYQSACDTSYGLCISSCQQPCKLYRCCYQDPQQALTIQGAGIASVVPCDTLGILT